MQNMTQNKKARVIQAINETETALARAMRYAADLRDVELIAIYESHLINLNAMLAA